MIYKIILVTSFLCCSISNFAQDEKPCLLIVIYDNPQSGKTGVCSNRAYFQEKVENYAEYLERQKVLSPQYNKKNVNFRYIASDESVVIYEYQKRVVGWGCFINVVNIKVGKTVESCQESLEKSMLQYPNDFASTPKKVFERQVKIAPPKKEYIEDFDGVKGVFYVIKKENTSDDFIIAKLTNTKQNLIAMAMIKTADGNVVYEDIAPQGTIVKKYLTTALDIQVLYRPNDQPKPSVGTINYVKEKLRSFVVDKDKLKIKKWDATCMCVRG
jgi:hypothetical protein